MTDFIMEYISRSSSSRKVLRLNIFSFFVALLLAVLALFKGYLPAYLILIIPTLIINEIFILYGCSQKADTFCINGVCNLNLCAALTRAALNPSGAELTKTIFFMSIGIIAAIFFGYVQRLFSENNKAFGKLSLFCTYLFLVMCFFMPEINQTKAWFSIGGKALFQLTEIAKFFYVIYIGTMFSHETLDSKKLVKSFFVTAVCCGMLVILNELGTILVMGSAFFCLCMLKFKKKSSKFGLILIVGILLLSVVLVYTSAESRLSRWKCPECTTVNNTNEMVCIECDTEAPLGGNTFKCPTCRFVTWDDDAPENATSNCPLCSEDSKVARKAIIVFKKIYDRCSVTYNYEAVKGSSIAYHMDRSIKSMKVGSLFGDKDNIVYVPNVDTDSVITGLTNRLGLVFVIFILFSFLQIFTSIERAHSPVRIMAICAVTFQALYTYLGTLNLIPMTGIGVPFISRGGSNLVITYILIYLILSSLRNNKEVLK